MTERQEDIQWMVERFLQYAEKGDMINAISSILSDVRKCDSTKDDVELRTYLESLGLLYVNNPKGDHSIIIQAIKNLK